jgi:hypothetical protein
MECGSPLPLSRPGKVNPLPAARAAVRSEGLIVNNLDTTPLPSSFEFCGVPGRDAAALRGSLESRKCWFRVT